MNQFSILKRVPNILIFTPQQNSSSSTLTLITGITASNSWQKKQNAFVWIVRKEGSFKINYSQPLQLQFITPRNSPPQPEIRKHWTELEEEK